MTSHRLSPVELRVLGSLMEKERTTPDQYPLSLNALRLACNQQTSRDPVMSLDEDEVTNAVRSLANAGWAKLASGTGSRVAKYRQTFDESLDLLPSESAILAVLFLRGPNTVNELRARTERANKFADNEQVSTTLLALAEKGLVRELERQPGQREARWEHLLASEAAAEPTLDDLIDAYVEAWNRHDLAAIDELHASGVAVHDHESGTVEEGAAVSERSKRLFAESPDLRFTIRSVRTGDGFAVYEWTGYAGDRIWEGVDIVVVKDGKILRKDVYSNASRRIPGER